MKPALEFESLFAVDVETEANDGPNDFINNFVAATLHEAAGGDPAKLDAETAVIDGRAKTIYKAIADAATKVTADPGRLAKSGGRVARTEVTKYSSGREVIAEIGEDGSVIRTFMKEGNQ